MTHETGITGTVVFASDYAMGRYVFTTSGAHAIPEIQIPFLADYAAHCQSIGQKVTPASYSTYTATFPEEAISQELKNPGDGPLPHLKQPGEHYLYTITPTDFTAEEGPADLLHLTVRGVDPEFDWLEIGAYFTAAALYQTAVRLLRHRAETRTWRLRNRWGALASVISPLVTDLCERADRLAALIPPPPAPRVLTLAMLAQLHTSYSDVLAQLRRHGVPDPGIDQRDACTTHITVPLPGGRALTARCAHTDTLPANPAAVRSWRIERTIHGVLAEEDTFEIMDPSRLAEVLGREAELVVNALAAATVRQQAKRSRPCPACDRQVWDNRLKGEPCSMCTPSHAVTEHTLFRFDDIAKHLVSEHGIDVTTATVTPEAVKRWASEQDLPSTLTEQAMIAHYLHEQTPHRIPQN
ncbi:hypothetical protein [Planomonospora parontospora]|uniref:hypothetical protein n=1 Tax=Planomonospora parontospora TaxID=58119 RepID=UPI0016713316|nr:hypothetical protein [Planomonospora parontospora]GGL48056.1 hypothetical protein GCM10014719_56660 [Planomonospora parontospora subsp. antibiotica]GII18792.1 hypothetical protein Ppa05_55180 [Planomonospora parontospora subsp. antibiotica]